MILDAEPDGPTLVPATTSGAAPAPPYILDLASCIREVDDLVGGKAVGLGQLKRTGFSVPAGFVVTTAAYRDSIATAGIATRIDALLAESSGEADQRHASATIQKLFGLEMMNSAVVEQVRLHYRRLSADGDATVAVRSSATAEDLADASFAGQQDTYLWVSGEDAVIGHVVKCWASLYTAQAIAYRARFEVPNSNLAMGVVVQTMVPATTAGVMMTLEPVTGNRNAIYIEAALGLGEGVVRGDVPTDRFWVQRSPWRIENQDLACKTHAHQFVNEAVGVAIVDMPPDVQTQPTLTSEEVLELAELGRDVEAAFGVPMDIEWALAGSDRRFFLLQARPETVWTQRRTEPEQDILPSVRTLVVEQWDPTHRRGAPNEWYSRDNVGEAMPGVLTPLTWSMWGPVGEQNARETARAIGVLSRAEAATPSVDADRYIQVFYGRVAMQARFLATIGDRMPGVSGPEVVRGIFAEAPEDMVYHPTIRRYPFIAMRLPWAFFRTPSRIRALAASTDAWWRQEINAMPRRDRCAAASSLNAAGDRFLGALVIHSIGLVAVVQPLYAALEKVVTAAGRSDVGVLSGSGGAEMAIVSDIWRASRAQATIDDVLSAHGFHGPAEGELSSTVWREDPSPIVRMVADYAKRDSADEPARKELRARHELRQAQSALLRETSALRRPAVRLLLKLAATRLPLRGVGKRSFVQSLDVARAAARRIGEIEVAAGRLTNVDDIFYLTQTEIVEAWPDDAQALTGNRRARRAAFEEIEISGAWKGDPELVTAAPYEGEGVQVLSGVGVSAGIIEGPARVVTDPAFVDVQPDEILVAPTTDPSWSSIMFVSAGLVVDIGGALSHAAVVARELRLPCVVSTRTGTQQIQTGDRIRVDGSSGIVTILERALDNGGKL